MRIYAFVAYYPSLFKAYYDAQFAALLEDGHDLRIFSFGSMDRTHSPKVVEYGLTGRTRRIVPDELRAVPRFVPAAAAALASHPWRRFGAAARITRPGDPWKRRLKEAVRAWTLPVAPPDVCLVHGLRTMTHLSWLRELYPGAPVALYYHGGEPDEAGALDAARVAEAFAGADIVFTNTGYSREEAVSRGCDPAITTLLPVGFDLTDYPPPDPKRYRPDGTLRLVSAGRLSEGKGLRFALEAVRLLTAAGVRNLRYTIIGDGVQLPTLKHFVAEHGLDSHVAFRGTLSNRELVAELADSDVLLLPSITTDHWAETQAAVVQEALLMKCAVVTTRTGGVPESIPEGMRRFSVPPSDARALAEAIARIARATDDELRELGEAGRRWAAARYDIRALNRRMLEAIRGSSTHPRSADAPPSRPAAAASAAGPLTTR